MNQEKYHELNVSPFYMPFLRDLGIKVVAIIIFDLMYGPICYIKTLSRSNYGSKLQEIDSLAEIYAGFARTSVDVVTGMDEKIVLGRYVQMDKESENTSILLFVTVEDVDTQKLSNYARSLVERSRGQPSLFNQALGSLIEAETKSAHKLIISSSDNFLKGLELNDKSVVSGTEFNNVYGFLFLMYSRSAIDGRFLPKMISGKKVDLIQLSKFIDTQKNEVDFTDSDLISLYYKGSELLIFQQQIGDLMIGLKKPQSRINYNYLIDWFKAFYTSFLAIKGEINHESVVKTLQYMDEMFSSKSPKYIAAEFFDLMLNSKIDHPELQVQEITLQKKGWITLRNEFKLFYTNLKYFKGDFSVDQISQHLSVPIADVVKFIIFLKSRDFISVYRKKR